MGKSKIILLLLLCSVTCTLPCVCSEPREQRAESESRLRAALSGYYGYSWERERGDSLLWNVQLSGVASSGQFAPFWFHSSSFGTVSARPFSGTLQGGIYKHENNPTRWIDYSASAQVAMQADGGFHIYPSSAYVSARLYVFRITAGFKPDTYDYDTPCPELTSGNLLFSQNSRPMPRITVSTNGYIPFPFLFGYVEVKAGLTHGWFIDNTYVSRSFLHHKYIGGRIGGSLPVNVSYEFHHAAQWGGVSPVHGELGNSVSSYLRIFSARNGGNNDNDRMNAEGNHVGSQQLTLTAKGNGWQVCAYWQNFFEDAPIKPIWSSVNIADGLWGICFKQNKWRYIEGALYELTNTTDQSGLLHDIDGLVIGGNDSYFTNSIYRNGWNFYLRSIGTPFITSPLYNTDTDTETQTLNNRVIAHHAGLYGDIQGYHYRILASHVTNYGKYNLTDIPSNRRIKSHNTALLIELEHCFQKAWGLHFRLSLAADIGSQFGNSFGGMLTICKKGVITQW